MVRRRQADDSLAEAQPYLMKGVNWIAGTRPPATGLDPRTGQTVPYGFFFDGPWRAPGLQGYELLRYWLRAEFSRHAPQDLELIQRLNANTAKVYTPVGNTTAEALRVLDDCYRRGLFVIVTVAVSKEDLERGEHRTLVAQLKDHPAILMWSLGNEWNLNRYFGYASLAEAIKATNEAAIELKQLDPHHPVSSAIADVPSDFRTIIQGAPQVEVWMLNVYRGTSFGNLISQWIAITSKPFALSEFSTDSFVTQRYRTIQGNLAEDVVGQEDRARQAEVLISLWRELVPHLSARDAKQPVIGGCVFALKDDVGKVGRFHEGLGGLVDYDGPDRRPGTADDDTSYDDYNPEGFVRIGAHPDNVANEEYFGLVDADRRPKAAYTALQQFYDQLRVPAIPVNHPPTIAPIAPQTAAVGEAKTFTNLLKFSDPDGLMPNMAFIAGGPKGLLVQPHATIPGVAHVFWPAVNTPGTWTLTAIVPDPQEGSINGLLAAQRRFAVIVLAPPASPTGLTATTIDSSTIRLTWDPYPTNAVISLEYTDNAERGAWRRLTDSVTSPTTYFDTQRIPGRTLYFRAVAITTDGRRSAPTAPVSATP